MPALANLTQLWLPMVACVGGVPGCIDQPQSMEPTIAERTADPATARASGDGALVIRTELGAAAFMFDFERNLTVTVGHTVAQLAEICGTGVFPQPWIELDVLRPTDALHIVSRTKEAPVLVYSGLAFDPCAELLGVTPLAEGTGQARYVDNDFFVSGPGAVSFGLAIEGRVTESGSGRVFHLNARFRNVILPDGTVKLPVIDVRLQPIGH